MHPRQIRETRIPVRPRIVVFMALGQAGVNIMEFCKAFNAETQQSAG